MNEEKNQTELEKIFGEVIYAYTRKQALADGIQTKLEGSLAAMAEKVYKYPVYITSGVWALINETVDEGNDDLLTVLWDVLYMSTRGKELSKSTHIFKVIFGLGTDQSRERTLYVNVDATDIDDPSPAVTIMLPEEN